MSNKPLVSNASDKKQVKEAGKQLELIEIEKERDYQKILAMPEGQRIFRDLLEHCKVYRSIFDDNALTMAYKSGNQDCGHFIVGQITLYAPAQYERIKHATRGKNKRG